MEDKEKEIKRVKRAMEMLKESYVIVEGKKDKKALEKLGITAETYSNTTIENAKGNVVILTDLDKEGERIAREILEKLRENNRVNKVDSRTRKELGHLLKLRRFEEIKKKYEKFLEVD